MFFSTELLILVVILVVGPFVIGAAKYLWEVL